MLLALLTGILILVLPFRSVHTVSKCTFFSAQTMYTLYPRATLPHQPFYHLARSIFRIPKNYPVSLTMLQTVPVR